MSTISIVGLEKAAVLAALYNASRPQGRGFPHYEAAPMSTTEAKELLKHHTYFDYIKGRVMKVDFGSSDLDTSLYNRDNGDGAAEAIIAGLQSQT